MSERIVIRPSRISPDCATLVVPVPVTGISDLHLCHADLLALAGDLAAILDTDAYQPKHARVAS